MAKTIQMACGCCGTGAYVDPTTGVSITGGQWRKLAGPGVTVAIVVCPRCFGNKQRLATYIQDCVDQVETAVTVEEVWEKDK